MAVNPNFVRHVPFIPALAHTSPSLQISDVMATFLLVSQALRTGEPVPEAFHQNLLDRLHYHGAVGRHTFSGSEGGAKDAVHRDAIDAISNYESMFYATAICAVYQVVEVSRCLLGLLDKRY